MRAVLAIFLGFFLGSAVNMALVMVGPSVIPLPDGVDPTDIESIKEHLDSYEPKHFLFMFLAHGLGTLVGAFIAAKVGRSMPCALIVGVIFLLGGAMMAILLPETPKWVLATDVLGMYIPMAWIGGRLGRGKAPADPGS